MSSPQITNVAVAGASGNLGKPTVDALVQAGYNVTVLTRPSSSSAQSSHAGVLVKPVDYTSKQSLVEALKGQQAVVSLLSGPALDIQPILIDAALEVGVTRFLPSEFGSDTQNPKVASFPIFSGKVKSLDYLKQKVAEVPSFSYTAILSGPFLDFCLEHGLILDPKNRKAFLVDGGDSFFSTTLITEVAKAIVGVLRNLSATKNRIIYTESFRTSQKQILDIGEKLTGSKWAIESATSKDLEAAAWAEIQKKDANPAVFAYSFLRVAVFSGNSIADFGGKVGNDLVGLQRLPDSVLEAEVKKLL